MKGAGGEPVRSCCSIFQDKIILSNGGKLDNDVGGAMLGAGSPPEAGSNGGREGGGDSIDACEAGVAALTGACCVRAASVVATPA